VAGVTHVLLSDPERGRDTITSMNRSATGTAGRTQRGSEGTGRSGTRVSRSTTRGIVRVRCDDRVAAQAQFVMAALSRWACTSASRAVRAA
jgi:hypothetical protein